jgi:hypothetical protein
VNEDNSSMVQTIHLLHYKPALHKPAPEPNRIMFTFTLASKVEKTKFGLGEIGIKLKSIRARA